MKKQNAYFLMVVLFIVGLRTAESAFAGYIVAWGQNPDGQLNVPVGTNFTTIASGSNHGLAIKADGSLVAWGSNYWEQLDDIPIGNDFGWHCWGLFPKPCS